MCLDPFDRVCYLQAVFSEFCLLIINQLINAEPFGKEAYLSVLNCEVVHLLAVTVILYVPQLQLAVFTDSRVSYLNGDRLAINRLELIFSVSYCDIIGCKAIIFVAHVNGLGLCPLGHKAVKGYHLVGILLIGVKLKALPEELGLVFCCLFSDLCRAVLRIDRHIRQRAAHKHYRCGYCAYYFPDVKTKHFAASFHF